MGAMKAIGGVLLVLSVLLLVGAVAYLFMAEPPASPVSSLTTTQMGVVLAAAGGVLLLAGVILMVVSPRKKAVPVVVPQEAPQSYEIKRTEMNWGGAQQRSVEDEDQAQLDAINQKMGRLKVQFGMGELSSESYKMLMAQYEGEKAVIERRVLERQGR